MRTLRSETSAVGAVMLAIFCLLVATGCAGDAGAKTVDAGAKTALTSGKKFSNVDTPRRIGPGSLGQTSKADSWLFTWRAQPDAGTPEPSGSPLDRPRDSGLKDSVRLDRTSTTGQCQPQPSWCG
jgi:hypothetical protein